SGTTGTRNVPSLANRFSLRAWRRAELSTKRCGRVMRAATSHASYLSYPSYRRMLLSKRARLSLLAVVSVVAFPPVPAFQSTPCLASALNSLTFRNLGPFRDGAWITTIAVPDAPAHDHLYSIWVGARSGGVWKTTNGGITWDPIFDGVGVAPIGAITVA